MCCSHLRASEPVKLHLNGLPFLFGQQKQLFPYANEVRGKVMSLNLSVILFTGVCPITCWDTHTRLDKHPWTSLDIPGHTPPGHTHPLDTLLLDTHTLDTPRFRIPRDTVNKGAVRVLLVCILVCLNSCYFQRRGWE